MDMPEPTGPTALMFGDAVLDPTRLVKATTYLDKLVAAGQLEAYDVVARQGNEPHFYRQFANSGHQPGAEYRIVAYPNGMPVNREEISDRLGMSYLPNLEMQYEM